MSKLRMWGMALSVVALASTASIAGAQPAAPPADAPAKPLPPPGAPRGGLSQSQMDELAQKHDGFYGALAPENLHKKRPSRHST